MPLGGRQIDDKGEVRRRGVHEAYAAGPVALAARSAVVKTSRV